MPVCVCVLPAACCPACPPPHPIRSQGRRRGTVKPPSLSLPCGEERVKRYKLLPGDVIAAEEETLQAGQAVQLSLEGEKKQGEGREGDGGM